MGCLEHKYRVRIVYLLCSVAPVLFVAGLVAPLCLAQEAAPTRGWWQVPTAELSFGPPLSIGFDTTGAAWIGTRGGVNILYPDGTRTAIALPLSDVEISAIKAGPDGSMWLATDSAVGQALGVRVIWPDGRQRDYTIPDGMADDHVRDLVFSADGAVWFATAGGLGHLSADGRWGRFTRAAGLVNDDVYALLLDAGTLWIGTYGGLSRLLSTGEWSTFTVTDGLASLWVRDLAMDTAGNLWCATGLGASVRRPDGTWQTFTVDDGLPSNVINAITTDEMGGVWFATNEGAGYLAANGQWLIYDETAGLLDNEVVAIEIDEKGQPWFATPGGLSVLIGGLSGVILPTTPSATPTLAPPEPTETPMPIAAMASPTAPTLAAAVTATAAAGPVSSRPVSLGTMDVTTLMPIALSVVLFLSIMGIGIVWRRIHLLRKAKRQGRPSAMPEGVKVAWEEGLVPATLGEEEPPVFTTSETIAPEAEEALAELERYMAGMAEMSTPTPQVASVPAAEEASAPVPPPSKTAPKPASEEMSYKALESWLRRATVEDVEDLMREGIRLAKQGRKAEAYDVFSTITRLVPDHVEAWLWKGGMALHPQESVRCLQKALELDPDNPQAKEGLAWALGKLATHKGEQ